jgi:hypothetical protein
LGREQARELGKEAVFEQHPKKVINQ